MRTNDYFMSENFNRHVSELLNKAGFSPSFEIIPFEGGKNNRVFEIIAGDEKVLLKAYFEHETDSRDRLGTEFGFSLFAWKNGLRCLPRPYAADYVNKMAIYEFISGVKLKPSEIKKEFVAQALQFFTDLNRHKSGQEAKSMHEASDACFSLKEHICSIEKRIDKLKLIKDDSKINSEAIFFVQNELLVAWNNELERLERFVDEKGYSIEEKIDVSDRCISPSDFEYHNAILGKNGKLYFLDFEYAGWDDPVKMVCDFFCQPKIPVPLEYFDFFVKEACSGMLYPEKNVARAKVLISIYRIKWCCLMLNEFLEDDAHRRRFSKLSFNHDAEKLVQLNKAKDYFRNTLAIKSK